jgi:hypothetical protein
MMVEKDIFFILVQIDEAHTPAWPQGIITLGIPQSDINDRIKRAQEFSTEELVGNEANFKVLVDTWSNSFAETYQAWPDKYFLFDSERKVVAKSTYGAYKNAVIDVDCVDLIYSL